MSVLAQDIKLWACPVHERHKRWPSCLMSSRRTAAMHSARASCFRRLHKQMAWRRHLSLGSVTPATVGSSIEATTLSRLAVSWQVWSCNEIPAMVPRSVSPGSDRRQLGSRPSMRAASFSRGKRAGPPTAVQSPQHDAPWDGGPDRGCRHDAFWGGDYYLGENGKAIHMLGVWVLFYNKGKQVKNLRQSPPCWRSPSGAFARFSLIGIAPTFLLFL